MVDISVVIPALNAVSTLGAQLEAVMAQQGVDHFEVVVVDNGSSDGTAELIDSYAHRDHRIRSVDGRHVPRGGGAAKNLGVELAASELIAFCDADDLVRPGWLSGIATALGEHPVVSVTREYWTLNPLLTHQFQERRLEPCTFLDAHGIAGGAFGIRRAVYLEVGGFDESLSGAVDWEFALRLHAAGYDVVDLVGPEVSVRLPATPTRMFGRTRALTLSRCRLRAAHRGDAGSSWPQLAVTVLALIVRTYWLFDRRKRLHYARLAGRAIGNIQCRASLSRRNGGVTPGR